MPNVDEEIEQIGNTRRQLLKPTRNDESAARVPSETLRRGVLDTQTRSSQPASSDHDIRLSLQRFREHRIAPQGDGGGEHPCRDYIERPHG